jgi:thiamine biosynthesis protein ThiS
MQVRVNGFATEIEEGVTLLEMLEREDEPLRHVIVERNGQFVHPSAYHAILLAEGDVIEAILPACGG